MCSARPRSAKRAARGFSLLEAVAATAFLAVALMAFAANTIWLTRDEKSADSTSAAHALAQQKLEQLRSTPLGAPEVAPGIIRTDRRTRYGRTAPRGGTSLGSGRSPATISRPSACA